jgi:hypothetical protein
MWVRNIALCMLAGSAHANESWLHKVGYAKDLKTGAALYSEHHLERYVDKKLVERQVEYRCPNGKRFAEKSLTLKPFGYVPDFLTRDLRNGYTEGVRTEAAAREVFVLRSSAATEEAKPLPEVSELVADAGFDVLIGERFEQLRDKEPEVIQFLVPSRLSAIEFRLREVARKPQDPESAVRFQLAPNSAFFRLLVDPLEVTYHEKTRRLMSFEGLTNLRDDEGDNYSARIDFPKSEQLSATKPDDFPARAAVQIEPNQSCESS